MFYGIPGAYGVVTMPFGVREGINIFLDGFVPTENMRFRETVRSRAVPQLRRRIEAPHVALRAHRGSCGYRCSAVAALQSLTFRLVETAVEEETERWKRFSYPTMSKALGSFTLQIHGGGFTNSEIIVLLGENGTGKTTFIRILAGLLKPDGAAAMPTLNVSYKPQKISPTFQGTVRMLFHQKIRDAYVHPQFITDVIKPLEVERLYDQNVEQLSGGELQRVALCLCLGQPADIYLIDEPSAYLDSEQRIVTAKVIKRFILHAQKTGFVVEHDFIMATYLADRVIVFEGQPGVAATARSPQTVLSGMNAFLKQLDITFRRDSSNFRPRINKANSIKDKEQKAMGNYFFFED